MEDSTRAELISRKQQILDEVTGLVALKKKLYSNMDIATPMSADEKELTHKIACMWSEINLINRHLQKLSGNLGA